MNLVILSNAQSGVSIREHLGIHYPDCHVTTYTDLLDLYAHLCLQKNEQTSVFLIDKKTACNRDAQVQRCIRKQCPNAQISFLAASAPTAAESHPTFDTSEIGLRRLTDYLRMLQKEDLKPAQQDLESVFKQYQTIINGAGEAIIGVDKHGCITFLNQYACHLFLKEESELLGKPLRDFALDSPLQQGANEKSFTDKGNSLRRVARGTITKSDGSFVYVEYTQTFVGNQNDDTVSIMVIEDISDRIKFEAKLKTLANRDMLTGLFNRYYLQCAVKKELNNRRSTHQPFALALIDLDDFKAVNDTHGHAAGDKLLAIIAKRLKDCVRRCDLVARLGGDEFVVMLKNATADCAERSAQNILSHIQQPVILEDQVIQVDASIGIYLSTSMTLDFKQTMDQMDAAMYRVKKNGKGGIYVLPERGTLSAH